MRPFSYLPVGAALLRLPLVGVAIQRFSATLIR
jgi:hypothetical protein